MISNRDRIILARCDLFDWAGIIAFNGQQAF
jgi:hypothetical protein